MVGMWAPLFDSGRLNVTACATVRLLAALAGSPVISNWAGIITNSMVDPVLACLGFCWFCVVDWMTGAGKFGEKTGVMG
jgi:hypothetical protein